MGRTLLFPPIDHTMSDDITFSELTDDSITHGQIVVYIYVYIPLTIILILTFQNTFLGTGDIMVQWLRMCSVLEEDQRLVGSTYTKWLTMCNSRSQDAALQASMSTYVGTYPDTHIKSLRRQQ